nr:DUF5655 domain-containing protein [Antrihabitans stalactiti]
MGDLDAHFVGTDPQVRELFDLLRAAVEPVDVLAQRTRIAFHIRMSFAAFMPRKHWLDGHLVLARSTEHPTFRSVQVFSPRNVLHVFRLRDAADVDDAFLALLSDARAVGEQRHLRQVQGAALQTTVERRREYPPPRATKASPPTTLNRLTTHPVVSGERDGRCHRWIPYSSCSASS